MSLQLFRRRRAPLSALTLAVFLATMLPTRPARASADDPDVTPTSHGVGGPSTMGVPTNSAGSADALITADPVTGASRASIAFALPTARGLGQPELSLSYNSMNGMGAGGMGWALDVLSIERKNDSGFPQFVNTNAKAFAQGTSPDQFVIGGAPLVPICVVSSSGTCGSETTAFPSTVYGWSYYHPELDTFERAFLAPDYSTWLVQLKSGVWLNFGVPSDNQTDLSGLETHFASSDNSGVYRWDLVRQFDPNNNEIIYSWASLGPGTAEQPTSQLDGLHYLTDIYDTPNTGRRTSNTSTYAHHTHLFWRGNDTVLRTSPGWKSIAARVLGDVAITSAPMTGGTRSLVRLYHMTYTAATAYEQRFLTQYQTLGCSSPEVNGNIADPETWAYSGASACPGLPATNLSYANDPSFALKQSWNQPFYNVITTGSVKTALVDTNGDGFADILASAGPGPLENADTVLVVSPGPLPSPVTTNIYGQLGPTTLGNWSPPVPVGPTGSAPSYGQWDLNGTGRYAYDGDALPGRRTVWGDWLGVNEQQALFIDANCGDPFFSGSQYPGTALGYTYELYQGSADGWHLTGTGPSPLALFQTVDSQGEPVGVQDDEVWGQGKTFDVDGDGLTDVALLPQATNSAAPVTQQRSYFTVRQPDGNILPFNRGTSQTKPANYNLLNYHAIADMDADGLADLVEVESTPDSGSSTFGPTTSLRWWKNKGDGRFGGSANTNYEADDGSPAPDFAVATGPNWPVAQTGANIAIGDVNGDSLADFVVLYEKMLYVYMQQPRALVATGTAVPFSAPVMLANAAPDDTSSVSIVNTDGSGTPQIVLANGTGVTAFQIQASTPRYGLLTTISDTATTKSTTITYDSVAHLSQVAASQGVAQAWTSASPVPVQVVVKIETIDGTAEQDGTAHDYTTTYAYTNPSYDARDHAFLGFGTVAQTTNGTAASPGTTTTTSYVPATCASAPCAGTDYGWRVRRGLAYAVQIADASTNALLSTKLTTFAYQITHTGSDGRMVRMVYPQQVDTFLGEAGQTPGSSPLGGLTALTSNDATFTWSPPSTQVPMAPGSTPVDIRETTALDAFGDTVQSVEFGLVGQDKSVLTTTTWALPSGDTTGWLYRPLQTKTGYGTVKGGAASFTGPVREMDYSFNLDGQLGTASAPLSGTQALQRTPPYGGATAPAPTNASADTAGGALIALATYGYDLYGNVSSVAETNGRCKSITYDTVFNQLAVGISAHRSGGCTSTDTLTTTLTYNRGLEKVTQEVSPSDAMTGHTYDTFGRLTETDPPSASSLGSTDSAGATKVDWSFYPQALHVTSPARESWIVYDSFMRQRLRYDSGDTAGTWILSGGSILYPSGRVRQAFKPSVSNTFAQEFNEAPQLTTASSTFTTDALGRVLQATAPSTTTPQVAAQYTYHALSVDTRDGEQIAGGLHAGSYATAVFNGHGLNVQSIQHLATNPVDTVTTTATYQATGEVLSIARSHTAVASDAYTRTFQYDSWGRMTVNVEPNTSSSSTNVINKLAAPILDAWRYAYDDSGDLVGTSDARGCGENLTYDALGRLKTEDYSPCTSAQTPYTPPTTSSGYEVLYGYDTPEASGVTDDARYMGKLTVVYDRAEHSQFVYDARGRVDAVRKQLAVPNNAQVMAGGYAPHWFEQDVTAYDEANRVVTRTTGVDPTLFGLTAQTSLTSHYTPRGSVSRVDGSYGALLASQTFNPDGSVNQQVFGDAAATTADFGYWPTGLPQTLHVHRPAGPWASASGYSTTGANVEDDLEDLDLRYDNAGNLFTIFDHSTAAWPAGASTQLSRVMTYDDNYRMTSIDTTYTGTTGNDAFVSPYLAEETAGSHQFPGIAHPANRVRTQGYSYDWLGNTKATSDDANVFPDRSLGTIVNGGGVHLAGTSPPGPNWLTSATLGTSSLATQYDAVGDVTQVTVSLGTPCASSSCTTMYSYAWDEVGRLASAGRADTLSPGTVADDVTETFAYDAGGQRVLKSYETASTSTPTVYTANVFDSLRLDGATFPDANGDYDRTDATEAVLLVANGVTYGRVVYSGSDPTLSASGTAHVFLNIGDHLGSASFIIDYATGELVERGTYQGYGAVDADLRSERWSNYRNAFRYTGHEDDAEVGLVYFGARYYATLLGRWMSADPMTIHGLGSDLNPYALVRGAPMRDVDPFGLDDDTAGCDSSSQSCAGATYTSSNDGGDPGDYSGGYSWVGSGVGTSIQNPGPTQLAVVNKPQHIPVTKPTAAGGGATWTSPSGATQSWSPYATTPVGAELLGVTRYLSWAEQNPDEARRAAIGVVIVAGALPVLGQVIAVCNMLDSRNGTGIRVLSGVVLGASLVPVIGGAAGLFRAAEGLDLGGMAAIRQLGSDGESAANILKNTERIGSASETAAYRVPDVLDHDGLIIGEVKNVGTLSYTNQLRDFSSYARANGYTFQLIVRSTTQLSGPLQEAVNAGDIILSRTLP